MAPGYDERRLLSPEEQVGQRYALCTDRDGVAMGGYDPTTYGDGGEEPLRGCADFSADHGGGRYLFLDEERRARFLNDPSSYVAAFGGYCAKAVSEDDVYWVDPTCYLRVGGRTLLFFRMELKDIGLLDTRQIWLDTSPDKRMEDATGFWAGGPPTVKQAGGAVAPASAAEMEHVGGGCACAAERRRSLKM